jgi:hypothetical protein
MYTEIPGTMVGGKAQAVSQLHVAKHEMTSSIIGLKVTRNDQFSLINYFA